MADSPLLQISTDKRRARERRIEQLARELGFQGTVEYRHARSSSGGAQYGIGPSSQSDMLIVFAEAFERDANPHDFSLEAMLAHERGHQLLIRHPRLSPIFRRHWGTAVEVVLASLIGSLIARTQPDRRNLHDKAVYDLMEQGLDENRAFHLSFEFRGLLEKLL